MRGKKAKAIREIIYGDASKRNDGKKVCLKSNRKTALNDPEGFRAKYRTAKKLLGKG